MNNSDEFNDYVNSLNRNKPASDEAYYKILTTTECNARCYYCFEKSFPIQKMSEDLAKKVAIYVLDNASKYGKLRIDWFGGEPLMNIDVIDYISDIITKSGITYTSGMITNGSLFNREVIEKAKNSWNLKNVQITLDGIWTEYEVVKDYKDKTKFEKIIENIHALVDAEIRVSIRINYSNNNVNSVLKTIDFLYREFKNSIHVYCSPLFENNIKIKMNISDNTDDIIYDKLINYDYVDPVKMLKIRSVGCGLAALSDHFVIGPDGKLYKCAESMLCSLKSEVGSITEGITNVNNLKMWASYDTYDECHTCALYPICLGGCKAYQLGITNIRCFRFRSQINKAILELYEKSVKLNEKYT